MALVLAVILLASTSVPALGFINPSAPTSDIERPTSNEVAGQGTGAPPGYGLTNRGTLQPHAPIYIGNNASFNAANGVRGGSGTPGDPFVISDWVIDMATYPTVCAGIQIENASKYAVIQNVEVLNLNGPTNYFGILLGLCGYQVLPGSWAENITVRNTEIHSTSAYGIESSYNTRNNNMSRNAVYLNASRDWVYGITTQGGTSNVTIWGNYVDARSPIATPHLTVGIQVGDWPNPKYWPCARSLVVAYNTVTNATGHHIISDCSINLTIRNNRLNQNYPGRNKVPGWLIRGIMVENLANYTYVYNNEIYETEHGIEVAAGRGFYFGNAIHHSDYAVYINVNGSFVESRWTLYDTVYDTTYWNIGTAPFYVPANGFHTVLDVGAPVTPTDFGSISLISNRAPGQIGYDWSGNVFNVSMVIAGRLVYDHQAGSISQDVRAVWTGTDLTVRVTQFVSTDIVFTLQSANSASFMGGHLVPSAYYGFYKSGALVTTVPTNQTGDVSVTIPSPTGSTYEVRFLASIPTPSVQVLAPVNNSVVPSSSVQAMWTTNGTGTDPPRTELTVDGGAAVNVTGLDTYTLSNLSDGNHVLRITATAVTGDSASESVWIFVDTKSPAIVITSPAENSISNSTSLLISWTASDTGSGISYFEIVIDGGPPVPSVSSNYVVGGLAETAHSVAVTAVDKGGLRTTAVVHFLIETTVSTPPPGGTSPESGPAVSAVTYVADTSEVEIAFTQPMNQTSVEKSFTLTPYVDHTFAWVNESHLRVVMQGSLTTGSVYQVTLRNGALNASGTPMQHPFLFQFLANQPADAVKLPENWVPIVVIVLVLLLSANWATAGVLVVHYRRSAKRVRAALNRVGRLVSSAAYRGADQIWGSARRATVEPVRNANTRTSARHRVRRKGR